MAPRHLKPCTFFNVHTFALPMLCFALNMYDDRVLEAPHDIYSVCEQLHSSTQLLQKSSEIILRRPTDHLFKDKVGDVQTKLALNGHDLSFFEINNDNTTARTFTSMILDGLKHFLSRPQTFGNLLYPSPLHPLHLDTEWVVTEWVGKSVLVKIGYVLLVFFILFLFSSMPDFYRYSKRCYYYEEGPEVDSLTKRADMTQEYRSYLGILGITLYRFYSGIMTASWLPYLIAMEGEDMWSSHQSLFMGIAKAIFCVVVCMNPLLGLIGDRATIVSHGCGRRLFIRLGVLVSGLGVSICLTTEGHFFSFFSGILVWRIGEGLNDTTTEALCPELVAPSQFQIASVIKSACYLVGGLVIYILLILLKEIHYSWLYYFYLSLMLLTSIPPLLLLNHDEPCGRCSDQLPLATAVRMAYIVPAQLKGGFPQACFASFVFSCGSAPMFFIYLMTRDLCGIENAFTLETDFSIASILFFLCAALAAGYTARTDHDAAPTVEGDSAYITSLKSRTASARNSSVLYAFAVMFLPIVICIEYYILGNYYIPLAFMYIYAVALGSGFGAVYARFQDACWHLLPADAQVANAMGFSMMSRLAGAGIGNLTVGLILDFFWFENDNGVSGYSSLGYVICFILSSMAACIAAWLATYIPEVAAKAEKENAEVAQGLRKQKSDTVDTTEVVEIALEASRDG